MVDVSPKKSLGQNFLKSKKALSAMVSSAEIHPGDYVLEVGPGKGALTEVLLAAGARVVACEIDERMIHYLSEKFSSFIESKQLILVPGDVLFSSWEKEIPQGVSYKLVANLPYYVATHILKFFLERKNSPTTAVLLVQKEVAERIVSRDKKSSILSLSVALYGSAGWIVKVPARFFTPKPKVDSAIILIRDIGVEKIPSFRWGENFFTIIKTAFSEKRKKALKNLKKINGDWDLWFTELDIPKNTRAEDILFPLWKDLCDKYTFFAKK
ncbi:MAG: 16S rRNA (adenine(1518)-N(6)/adenine(1519)-N(6))-dimethyltransferase RsmA [Candidatus Pacebacteria bacterium]|nr:16S rRNA (adenine(1518)-N(6)/adenine(1519)-N(6))-dimethyltransferase RsmA [Candidatus Paceibacterota bacterium]